MAARRPATQDTTPQATPAGMPSPGFGSHHDHSFTLQAVMEMRQSIGELKSSIDNMNTTVQSTKTKVEDLVNWKNRILGGAIVLGILGTVLGFLISKFSDYVTISQPTKPAITQPATLAK